MDIYNYISQLKSFLQKQNQEKPLTYANPVPANLVMQFKRASMLSVLHSKQFLSQFPPIQQVKCIEIAEKYRGQHIIRDPIEDDPNIRPLYESVCKEAWQEVEEQHNQKLKELEKSSPGLAKLFRSGRGLCHPYWLRVKQLLWERYQIEWRTPVEMNPWTHFD